MQESVGLTGIARAKGKAAGEALVNSQRMGWAYNHVGNEDGIVLCPELTSRAKARRHQPVVQLQAVTSQSGSHHLPDLIESGEGHGHDHAQGIVRCNDMETNPSKGDSHDNETHEIPTRDA